MMYAVASLSNVHTEEGLTDLVEVVLVEEESREGGTEEWEPVEELCSFSIDRAQCFNPQEEALLRQLIRDVGVGRVDDGIRHMVKVILRKLRRMDGRMSERTKPGWQPLLDIGRGLWRHSKVFTMERSASGLPDRPVTFEV